jgi:hypothetical protein
MHGISFRYVLVDPEFFQKISSHRIPGRTALDDSNLNPYRFRSARLGNSKVELNITEATINELLTNVTFSLLSLGLYTDDTTVQATEFRSTYDFSQPINLILPYALCLAAGLGIVIMGLVALKHNGVPATDGFVQIMLATRGRTELERLVLEKALVDADTATRELGDLKIRYGKLVVSGEGPRMHGFGTVNETISLLKEK